MGGRNVISGKSATQYQNSETITINAVQMTTSQILSGNTQNNSITAGSGGATLWGGNEGNDTLTGGTGRDVFIYAASNGNDTIKKFTSGTAATGDVLNVSAEISSMTRNNGSLILSMSDGGTLTVEVGAEVDSAVQYSPQIGSSDTFKVKIGNTESKNNFTYDSNVEYYFGGNKENILNVSESAEIWLDKENFSNITEVNAATSAGNNLLAGDSNNNTLIGGKGNSSLWGGTGGEDILTGGSGKNIFWYGANEGNDKITNSKSDDTLNLYNVSLSDIVSIEEIKGGLKINIASGSLEINGAIPVINLGDNTAWKYDSENSTFNRQ